MSGFSLFHPEALPRSLLLNGGQELTYSEVLYRASQLAQTLPDARYCILRSEGLDHFIYGWLAALMRGQTLLLPPSRAAVAIEEIHRQYPDSYCLNRVDDKAASTPVIATEWLEALSGKMHELPRLPADHLAAVVFTSGSTGQPEPNLKYWGDLVQGSRALQARLGISRQSRIMATVPAQHMYGLETSVLAPLLSGASVHAQSLFFPADIHQAMENLSSPPVLVTTPLHLRALVNAGLEWPRIRMILSATAPLQKELASEAENCFQAPVMEVFGCSEAGSFSSRRPAMETDWFLYDSVTLRQQGKHFLLDADHLPSPVRLTDRLELMDHRHFRFLGRQQDMIKVAGKRISLTELNTRLLQIPGVEDGVFLLRNGAGRERQRLMALVVAPDMVPEAIRQELLGLIDPVFLPRPLVKVASLPRNPTGKLPQGALDRLIQELNTG
ncbi:AMP-binding protein [Thiolapillus brandeum]|uniref:AMP-binding protein n=1 Tax=Thiolapillus brandeum TaxID=1076588 RepID=UPI0005970043|nr:AMP-binding protein [Thiolapillus brandeum]